MNKKQSKNHLPVIHAHAAGIDIGSKSHYLAVGQSPEDVYELSVNTQGHCRAIEILQAHSITTIAMESTGSYWQPLFFALQQAGFEVLLVSGNQTTNARAKTDVKDCQWIQKLHSLGLLSGCFLPDEATLQLRTLSRHRASLVEAAAACSNKIQKCLRLMNLRLDVAIRDVAGKSGRAIIAAILEGQQDASALASLADVRVKKSPAELKALLQGQYRAELLYELKDNYELMKIYEQRIEACDEEIEKIWRSQAQDQQHKEQDRPAPPLTKKQNKGKHACTAGIQQHSYEMLGIDLFSLPGIGPGVALTFMSEMGRGIFKFSTAAQFASWLRLAPNNRISGGRVLSSRTPKSRNLLTKALRDAANALGRMKNTEDRLVRFFKKMAFKKGRGAAITATARKLAVIVWNMIIKKEPYRHELPEEQQQHIRNRQLSHIVKEAQKHHISLAELALLIE